MKKIVLLSIGFIAALFTDASAQTFTVKDTVRTTVIGYNTLNNDVVNTTAAPIRVTWKVAETDFPASWKDGSVTGICDNQLCRPGVIENKSFTSLDIDPGDKMEFHLQMSMFNLPDVGTHYLKINFTDGTTTKDAVFVVNNKIPASVNSVTKAEDITLYPNPARNELNVLFNESADIKNISIYNMIGKPVVVYKVSGSNSAKLNIESIPSGVYFVRLINGQGQVSAIRKFTHL